MLDNFNKSDNFSDLSRKGEGGILALYAYPGMVAVIWYTNPVS